MSRPGRSGREGKESAHAVVLRVLRAAGGATVTKEALDAELGAAGLSNKTARPGTLYGDWWRVRIAAHRARLKAAPGERVESVQGVGYRLVAAAP